MNSVKFKIVHVLCSKTSHHTYSNNCTIIRYSNILTCGNPPTYFGLFWPSLMRSSTIKNTVMTIHVIDVQW